MDVPILWKDTNIFYNILCFLITENEKLFDSTDARLYWSTVYHISVLIHHAYLGLFGSSLEFWKSEYEEVILIYEYRIGLLTGWNILFQTAFLFLALAYDILEWVNKHELPTAKKIEYWRDVVFNGLVVPYTLFVTSMFWSIYSIDRELVFPKIYDSIIPWWFNHCVHTNISIIVLIETILTPRRHPRNRSLELKITAAVGIGYAVVYYSIYFITNRWLYNVFGVMNWWQICLYQLMIWASSFIFYFLHFPINRLIHGQGSEVQEPGAKETETDKTETNGVESFEIENMKKNTDLSSEFSSDAWSLKYRSLRDKFENSRL